MKNAKKELQCKIEDLLRNKNTNEYQSYTLARTVYISKIHIRKPSKSSNYNFICQMQDG